MGPDHKVYDDEDNLPLNRPDLREQEKISGGFWKDDEKKAADKSSLSSQEKETGLSTPPSETGRPEAGLRAPKDSRGAGLWNPVAQMTPLGKLASFFSAHKKKSAAAGVAGIVAVIIGIFGAGGVEQAALVSIEKNLQKYETKVEQHFEKKGAQKLVQTILKRAKEQQTDPKAVASDEAAGGQLTKAIDDFPITDPNVEGALNNAGLEVKTVGGKFAGVTDINTGKDVTNKLATDDSYFAEVENALPEWSAGQINDFRGLVLAHSGATEAGIPSDEDPSKVDQTIEDEVVNGSSTETAPSTVSESNNPDPQDPQGAAQLAAEGGEVGQALQAAENASLGGASETGAIRAGVNSVSSNIGNTLLATGTLTTLCSMEQEVNTASINRVKLITDLLARHGVLLLSLADELKTGNENSGTINHVMETLDGDTPADLSSKNSADRLPFSSAAVWQRATGGTVTSSTPDIESSSLPVANAGTKIVAEINGLLSKTGLGFTCNVITSPFGIVLQGVVGVTQLATGDFGGGGLALTAGNVVAQQSLQSLVLPQIIRYFLPVGINGLEPAVQWISNAGIGMNLTSNDYARSIGGMPVSMNTADGITSRANQDGLVARARESWAYRTFSLSNPDSLLTKMVMNMTLSPSRLFRSIGSFVTGLPGGLLKNLGAIFSPASSADSSSQNPGEPYGITQYAVKDDLINKYDPIGVDKYLNTKVCVTDSAQQSYCAKRLDMAGDPTSLSDPTSDPSTTDLLHCFVDGYSQFTSENGPDPICGTMGEYDYSNDNKGQIAPIQETANSPTDNVEASYCDYLNSNDPNGVPDCVQQVYPQLNDDIGQYQVYLLWAHVMKNYMALVSSQ